MRRFLNLTNGIEWLSTGEPFDGYVRIQSTACEQKRWGQIIAELDYSFLVAAASGESVEVVDFSARERCPRALWQGLVWVELVLNDRWFGIRGVRSNVTGRGGESMVGYLTDRLAELHRRDTARVDYVERFVAPSADRVELRPVWGQTAHDGDYGWYAALLSTGIA